MIKVHQQVSRAYSTWQRSAAWGSVAERSQRFDKCNLAVLPSHSEVSAAVTLWVVINI